jgi:hypothetical protein
MWFKFLSGKSIYDRHNTVWRTKTGRQLPIFWMTDNHINNCIRCLNGEGDSEIPDPYFGKSKMEWMGIFETELCTRREENIN